MHSLFVDFERMSISLAFHTIVKHVSNYRLSINNVNEHYISTFMSKSNVFVVDKVESFQRATIVML